MLQNGMLTYCRRKIFRESERTWEGYKGAHFRNTGIKTRKIFKNINKENNKFLGLSPRPPFVGEVSANFFADECYVISLTDPHGSILGFLDRSSYVFFQVAPQL
jgi:hypothetical protein